MQLDPQFILTAFMYLFQALPITLLITAVSLIGGFIIALPVALVRINRVPVLSQIASVYVTVIRGTPMLMHLFLIYYGLPILIDSVSQRLNLGFTSVSIPIVYFVFIAFSLTAGAYMSEVIRSGIQAVDRGQIEAAYSVGMTPAQTFKRIVLPQALAVSLLNLSSEVIGMLHGTTLAFTVSVTEINGRANIVASTNWKFFEAYIAAALMFWGLTVLIERVTARIERKINTFNRGGVA
ncbi:amino acid ABC transporter permease [Paenibacillus sp. YPG26]|uniref:amino acid ABC transporter permease n=1 Tax=Paenibacillus sp. YPG26 TaxID=2878915 RepID=UPI00203EFC5F|nr:amino acid ABC transporter permease [Paenibacillus sp. YPG26]USB34954.1 amino acid ABC transporter permease [Paenibacillus sp. YPG26]